MINIGIGVSWATKKAFNATNTLIANFKARVLADGGTFEAEACLKATLTELNSIV